MIPYYYFYGGPCGPVIGPYDDPDYVANQTAGAWLDEEPDEDAYTGPYAVYDP